MPQIKVHLNASRSGFSELSDQKRRLEAFRSVKMFLIPAPRKAPEMMGDGDVPDCLVTDEMVDRFLALSPPLATPIQEFQTIILEIEKAYVLGLYFSALSASCVTIERLLNQARKELHKHHRVVKDLWGRDALNDWGPNIDALQGWGYLEADFAAELKSLYRNVRCAYLHSQPIGDLLADALRAVTAAHELLLIFVGFPKDLFHFEAGSFVCNNEADPRFVVFYKPFISDQAAPIL